MKEYVFDHNTKFATVEIPKGAVKAYFEVYGSASFGNNGYGGKSYGYYKIPKNIKELYVYVGSPGYNGGVIYGNTKSISGGATDIRTVKASDDSWYDINHTSWKEDISLLSRIIVAGGAGVHDRDYWRGDGGGLEGGGVYGKGGTQTSGGMQAYYKGYHTSDGDFGVGGYGPYPGGSGWYGGGGAASVSGYNGGGGSGYIDLLEEKGRGTIVGGNNAGAYGKAIIRFIQGCIFKIKSRYYTIENNETKYIESNTSISDMINNNCVDISDSLNIKGKFRICKLKES